MNIRERVEQNVTIWLLSTLAVGFAAGWGAYEAILKVSQREVVAKEELDRLRSGVNTQLPLTCEKYGVSITQRRQKIDRSTDTVFVSGSVESLPQNAQLWIAATGRPGSIGYYPRDPVYVKGKQWELEVRPQLKGQNDKKRFSVFIVGKTGQSLIEFYRSAMRQVAPDGEWPPLTVMTSDMVQCPGLYEVSLK